MIKALALGARAVLIGRPYVYGLAVDGARGVTQVLDLFAEDLRNTMQLLGCDSVTALDRSWLRDARPGRA